MEEFLKKKHFLAPVLLPQFQIKVKCISRFILTVSSLLQDKHCSREALLAGLKLEEQQAQSPNQSSSQYVQLSLFILIHYCCMKLHFMPVCAWITLFHTNADSINGQTVWWWWYWSHDIEVLLVCLLCLKGPPQRQAVLRHSEPRKQSWIIRAQLSWPYAEALETWSSGTSLWVELGWPLPHLSLIFLEKWRTHFCLTYKALGWLRWM